MQHALQEHGEKPSYFLSLQSDSEGLEAYDDRDMDEESEGSKGGHGKGASLREPSESQSGSYSDASITKRENDGTYGKEKEQEVRVNNKTPQSTTDYDKKFSMRSLA